MLVNALRDQQTDRAARERADEAQQTAVYQAAASTALQLVGDIEK